MGNQSVNKSNTPINTSRRKLLATIGRSVLLVIMTGATGFLFRRRRCWSPGDVNYSQLPCQDCRQLKGCERPSAIVYNNSQSNDRGSD